MTGDPVRVTHTVRGSFPICSVVKLWVSVTGPGKVTGIAEPQTLPVDVTDKEEMVFPVESMFQVMPYLHESRVILSLKDFPICN